MIEREDVPARSADSGRKGRLLSIGWVGLGVYALTGLMLLAVVVARLVWDVPVGDLTRDPATVAGTHPFVGWLSNVGVLGWCAAAAICLFTAAVLRGREAMAGARRFLIVAGLFTVLVMVDDFFLLHDEVLPVFLGIAWMPVCWFYVIVASVIVVVFRREVLASNYVVLAVALLCFGLSLALDELSRHTWVRGLFLIEDGFKLIGIASWALYFGTISYEALRENPGKPS